MTDFIYLFIGVFLQKNLNKCEGEGQHFMKTLLALPSGALVVSQFQDPVQSRPVRHIGLIVLICSQ